MLNLAMPIVTDCVLTTELKVYLLTYLLKAPMCYVLD